MRTIENNLRQLARNHGIVTDYDPFIVLINRLTGHPGASVILKYLMFRWNICDQWIAADSQIETETGINPTRTMKQRLDDAGVDRTPTRDGCIWQINRPRMAKNIATHLDASPIVVMFALSTNTNITPAMPNVTPALSNEHTDNKLTKPTKLNNSSSRLVEFPHQQEKPSQITKPQQILIDAGVFPAIATTYTGTEEEATAAVMHAKTPSSGITNPRRWLGAFAKGTVAIPAKIAPSVNYTSFVNHDLPDIKPAQSLTSDEEQVFNLALALAGEPIASLLKSATTRRDDDGTWHITFTRIPRQFTHPKIGRIASSWFANQPVKIHESKPKEEVAI